jgi:predicted nuclease of predicted toxin-antitoxin system
VKLLLDMNLSPIWVGFLRDHGFDAKHWSEIGDPRAPDPIITTWARDHGHIVITSDLDFSVIVALARESGPSIVQLRVQDVFPAAIGADVVRVLREQAEPLERGAIVSFDAVHARVRVLPIASPPKTG